MKLFSLILHVFVLVACVALIFGTPTSAYDDDEGEIIEDEMLEDRNRTQNFLSPENRNGTVEVN